VKSGGHALNPGFSSTWGVHIAMRRFSNVSVLGGRVSDVGVDGFILGGGYGWKSNQYGLGIDNIFEYELELKYFFNKEQ
jgi:hypothetical protein